MRKALVIALAIGMAAVPDGAPWAQEVLTGTAEPLTDEPGNPLRGRRLVTDIDNVTCLICHVLPFHDEPDMGGIGPSLVGIGSRLTPAELRQRLVNPKAMKPDSIMPSYFRTEGLYRVGEAYRGRTIYSAQEVEDVVAYLTSLKEAP